jgi:hypothetical protein
MSRGQLRALMAALTVAAFAPRLAAQDTSATRETRSDTSGYNGTAGIDTTAQPGRVGAVDSSGVGAMDSSGVGLDSTRRGAHTIAIPGRADRDSTGPLGASDSSGMRGRHPSPTKPGDSTNAKADSSSTDSSSATDSASVSQPSKQPGQSTSRTGDSTSSSGP